MKHILQIQKKLSFFLAFVLLVSVNQGYTQMGGADFQVGPTMNKTRIFPLMSTLDNGRVAIFGGRESGFLSCGYTDLYDPLTNTFTELAMNTPRDFSAIVKLTDGRYMLAGGAYDLGVAPGYNTAEIFDPADNSFTPTGNMVSPHTNLNGAQLSGGKVLFAGGWYDQNSATYPELFDPASGNFTQTGALNTPRTYPVVLPADDGGALVVGGYYYFGGPHYTSVEYYNVDSNSFSLMSDELIPSDSGWTLNTRFNDNPIADVQMNNGNYLLMGYRDGEYALLEYAPDTKTFTKINTSQSLIDTTVVGAYYHYVLDNATNMVYMLGLKTGSDPVELALVSVSLTTGNVVMPSTNFVLPQMEYLYPTLAVYDEGKVLMSGVSSSNTDYFNATNKTYMIQPEILGGIGDMKGEWMNVKVFPNPASTVFNLEWEVSELGEVEMELYDLKGMRVYDEKSKIRTTGIFSHQISTENLNAGLYKLLVKNGLGQFTATLSVK